MTFLLTVKVFDLEDVLFFFLGNNVSTCSRRLVATTLLLSSVVPEISWVVLILLTSLALVGGLLLNKHISRKKVSRLNLPKDLVFGWFMALKKLGINLLGA